MSDIFISTLKTPLADWKKAFPKMDLHNQLAEVNVAKADALVFWLHMNPDRQQWLKETMQAIKQAHPQAKMIVLANVPNQAEALFALGQGALGYSHAYSTAKMLKEIKAVVLNNGVWMGNELLQQMIQVSTKLTNTQADYVDDQLSKLTNREQEVAKEAAKGLSNKEIARNLAITPRTVKAHLANVFEKLDVKDRLHLALVLNKKLNI